MTQTLTKNKPSHYQEAIYQQVITTTNNIAISATAGSGKTTTLVEIAKLLPYGKRVLFAAFNKHIVNELKDRLPAGTDCFTMHSIGCKAIFNHYNTASISDNKQIRIIEPYFSDVKPKEKWGKIYEVDKLMRLARATMTKANREEFNKLIDTYALDIEEKNVEIAIKALRELYRQNEERGTGSFTMDFMDMIEHCVLNQDVRMPQYDYILLDEAQDFSKLDHLFIDRLVRPIKGRRFIVGDKNQAIYSFRGSDPHSFETLINKPNTVSLPLSISYRCAKSIVEEARKVYTDIESFEGNEEGEVIKKGKVESIEEGDMVVCRNTRPLIELFFMLVGMGKKAYVLGKDMEKGLLVMLSEFYGEDSTIDKIDQLQNHIDKIDNTLKQRGVTNPKKHLKYIAIEEKISILRLLFSKFTTISQVESFIMETFDDEERSGIKLMTIHKSKGLECDNVYLIETFEGKKLIPSQYAVTKDQLTQENNLRFVATTRAKKKFVYLNL